MCAICSVSVAGGAGRMKERGVSPWAVKMSSSPSSCKKFMILRRYKSLSNSDSSKSYSRKKSSFRVQKSDWTVHKTNIACSSVTTLASCHSNISGFVIHQLLRAPRRIECLSLQLVLQHQSEHKIPLTQEAYTI